MTREVQVSVSTYWNTDTFIYVLSVAATAVEYLWERLYGSPVLSGPLQKRFLILRIEESKE